MLKKFGEKKILIFILLFAFLIRIHDISSPVLSMEETRVASRGYLLAENFTDELGRKFPLVFNSSTDYQLPLTSYVTGVGIKIFGKNDLGARIPFVLLGTLLIFLIYKLSLELFKDKSLSLLVAYFASVSPGLIFISKVPNQNLILTVIFILIFYILIFDKSKSILYFLFLLAALTSKIAWVLLFPITLFIILFYGNEASSFRQRITKNKQRLIVGLFFSLTPFLIFLQIPQSTRSFLENNLTLVSQGPLEDNINLLRGHGIEKGLPNIIEKLLFNKLQILALGVVQWLGHLNPITFFGNISDGKQNYKISSILPKSLILPFAVGVYLLIKEKTRLWILGLIGIILLPSALIYPEYSIDLIFLTSVLVFLVIGISLPNLKNWMKTSLVLLVLLETLLFFANLNIERKLASGQRQQFIKNLVQEIYGISQTNPIAISDDILHEAAPYFIWFTPYKQIDKQDSKIDFAYKYSQKLTGNLRLFYSDSKILTCYMPEKDLINTSLSLLSTRDYQKVKNIVGQDKLELMVIKKFYGDNGGEIGLLINKGLCLQ